MGTIEHTKEALKPCPFCGGDNVKTFGPCGWYRTWGISHSCKSFYSGTSEFFQGFHSEAEAIAAWNRRAPTTPVEAPDMYEALKRAEVTITQHIRTGPDGGLHELSAEQISALVDTHPTIKLIRSALQKATPQEIR